MADEPVDLDRLRAKVAKQGGHVRQLKKDSAAQPEVTAAVQELKRLKVQLEEASKSEAGPSLNREVLDDCLLRRMFVVPSFEIHGGVAGLYDFGPPGCLLKDNILTVWKRHFVLQEQMLQVECTCMTPEVVLKTSGHVDRFTDLMVKDPDTGECYRADKLLEGCIEKLLEDTSLTEERRTELGKVHIQADAYTPAELHVLFGEYGITSPSTGNVLSEPFPFNLMFGTTIGPEGTSRGFLRPETAQGIFVNFRRLLEYNGGKMPFAAAQIGLGFRNEISPRYGLLRVREFTMGEIEHFVHPDHKEHPKFGNVSDVTMTLFPSANQLGSGKTAQITIGEAVKQGIVANETLGYFMARTHLFCEIIGIDLDRLRFRQHLPTEMAHYACDCWDAEIKMSYGWIECVGHADRSCYDLKVHTEKSKVDLKASRAFDKPVRTEYAKFSPNKKVMGKALKRECGDVIKLLEALSTEDAMKLEATLGTEGTAQVGAHAITREMCKWEMAVKTVSEERFFPGVIEPSFGMGRIIYAVLEHSFSVRSEEEEKESAAEDEKGKTKKKKKKDKKGAVCRSVLAFPPSVAPIKCGVLPLMKTEGLNAAADDIAAELQELGLYATCDKSGAAIGKKYARLDEIGAPFAITVDPDTLEGKGVTVRERDSQEQIRVPKEDAAVLIARLCSGRVKWEEEKAARSSA